MKLAQFILTSCVVGCSLTMPFSLNADVSNKIAEKVSAVYAKLPPLPYGYDSLEPYIDTKTMEIHYSRHHKAYIDNLNKAIDGTPWAKESLELLFAKVSTLPMSIRNYGGGHWNHSFYWQCLTPDPAKHRVPKRLEKELVKNFGSIEKFKEEFNKAAMSQFGSGWAWLIRTKEGKLKICNTPNQDNPLMDISQVQGTPLLTCDVWEHAYYLKHQNKRDDYVKDFWDIVNWKRVDELCFAKSK